MPVKLGATGRYPLGKLDASDEGELAAAVAYDPRGNLVRIEFGKPVAWLALRPKDAIALAEILVKNAKRGTL